MRNVIIQVILSILVSTTASASLNETAQLCKVTEALANTTSGTISFEVPVKNTGTYFIQLWQCPARLSNGELQSYYIEVNGKRLPEDIHPKNDGWGYAYYDIPVSITVGTINISVWSPLPAIPNVEFVELVSSSSPKKSGGLNSAKYDNYIESIRRGLAMKIPGITPPTQPKDTAPFTPITDLPTSPKIPYGYKYHNISWFGYTFYTTAYLKKGQDITCSSKTQGNVSHFLEIFSSTAPGKYSWTALSNDSGTAELSISIPMSGIYYVKARPFKNGSTGLCDININNMMSYKDVPICTMGVTSSFYNNSDASNNENSTFSACNIFTTSTQCDPIMWIYLGGTYDGTVHAFNNDYESEGDLNWDKNARIKGTFSKLTNKILISSASSFDPIGICELYAGCKNLNLIDTSFGDINFKYDDVMISAPKASNYNCYAWSGGSCSSWEDPTDIASPTYKPGLSDLELFDRYYSSERYPGCTIYERTSSITENAVGGVDLWATTNSYGYAFQHASIGNNSDTNHHGYAWESKLGKDYRIFHPRNALAGSIYGQIVYHYEPVKHRGTRISLEEAIANGTAIMENPCLSESQELYIASQIAVLPDSSLNNFNSLYDKWQTVWDNSPISNSKTIKENSSYSQLLKACKSNANYILLVYDKINKGVQSANPLFEDLVLQGNEQNQERLKNIHANNDNVEYDDKGRKIVRTISSNLKRLLIQLIPDATQKVPGLYNTSNSQIPLNDNTTEFSVALNNNHINVNVTLTKPKIVSADILDLNGRVISQLKNPSTLDSGRYQFTSQSLEPSTYLVRLMINGCLNVKKTIIR